jgi:tetratricopeptide (TPR) repeat protein
MKDKSSAEIYGIWQDMRMAREAHDKGNDHYNKGEFLQAYDEYQAGLQYSKSNIALLSNMAACLVQLGIWEQCVQICNEVIRIKPDHKKAL